MAAKNEAVQVDPADRERFVWISGDLLTPEELEGENNDE